MCYSIEVAKTNKGTIEMCSSKPLYRLKFSNILLTFNAHSIDTFLNSICACYQVVSKHHDKEVRNIGFDSVVNSISFQFSVKEVAELKYLLETALIESEGYFAQQN